MATLQEELAKIGENLDSAGKTISDARQVRVRHRPGRLRLALAVALELGTTYGAPPHRGFGHGAAEPALGQ